MKSTSRSVPNRLPVGRAGLDDAVGVEEHVVAGFEGFLHHHRRTPVAEGHREGGGGGQDGDDPAAAEHQPARVSGGDDPQPAGALVEFGQHAGDQPAPVVVTHRGVDVMVGLDQVEPAPAGVAVRGQGQAGEHHGAHPATGAVPDGVEQGEVGDVAVDRVVEGVATHVVAGLQDPADDQVAGGEGERRELGAQHLGGQAHRLAAADRSIVSL